MKEQEGNLEVWHIPQVPGVSFRVPVNSPEEAVMVLNILAVYDLFQYKYHIKPDYSNAQGLVVFENGEWVEWEDENGCQIDEYVYMEDLAEKWQMQLK